MVVVEATPAVEATPGGSGSVTSCSVQLGSCPMHPEFADLTYNDEIAPEPTGHGLPLSKCEAYNRVYEQPYGSS